MLNKQITSTVCLICINIVYTYNFILIKKAFKIRRNRQKRL